MKRDIEVLNRLYKVVDMGIFGVEEVIKKVEDPCLEKLMIDQKKEYAIIRSDIKKFMDEYEEDPKGINPVVKMSNDLMTNMKLMSNEDDKAIAKMMLEGTNKGIIEVTNIKNEEDFKNKEICEIVEHLLSTLEYNEKELKKYI